MLPPERELQERYQVSRATVRHALDELEREGVLKRIQGIGTIISDAKIRPEIMKLTSFTEDMLARGLQPGSKTLDLNLVVPPQIVQNSLALKPDEKVWYVKRLRLADQEPVGLNELYIPPTLEFAPADLNQMLSYYTLLDQRHHLRPMYAVEHLTARVAAEEEAAILAVSVGSPLLFIKRITYTEDNTPLEYVNLIYRADRYEYQVTLYRK